MKMWNRTIVGIGMAFIFMAFSISWGAEYPIRPITLMCGYTPGGPNDLQSRAIAEAAGPLLGQPITVVNKPGATGSIMMKSLATSKNDGYTIAVTPASLSITPHIEKVPYDVTKDFTYILALTTFTESFCVPTESPFKTLGELIDYSRQHPDEIKMAVSDAASSAMLVLRSVGEQSGARWTPVPFIGEAALVPALLGGHVHGAVSGGAHIPQVRAGKLRLLANATEKRLSEFPQIPTLRELGFDYSSFSLAGVAAPKGVPEPIVKKLQDALVKARNAAPFQEIIKKMYLQPRFEIGKSYESEVLKHYKYVGEFIKKHKFLEKQNR